jgi:UPF0755 protein
MFRAKPYRLWLVFLLTALIILSLSAYWQVNTLLLPVGTPNDMRPREVNIPFNSSTAQIAGILQQEGIIKSSLLFRFYARYKGYDQKLQAGNYLLSPGMTLDEILSALQQGVILERGVKLTIPEGFTVEQIAGRLEEEGLAGREEFLDICLEYRCEPVLEFIQAAPSGVEYLLEGYLFPDTYEILPDVTPQEIVEMMLRRFARVFDDSFRQRAAELGFSPHEIVTLASLVEKEARVPEERPLISAVFHNRLKSENMPFLQSCATVQYILGEVKPVLTYQDLEIDSPYNTYLYPGLPPGPIASPGKDALQAALYPADVDYLYFVYKEDGSGEHYFSTTLEEHNYHKGLARQNRQQN